MAAGAEAVGSPIPGTQKAEAIGGKLGRADIELSIAELTEIEAGAAQIQNPGVLYKKPPKPCPISDSEGAS